MSSSYVSIPFHDQDVKNSLFIFNSTYLKHAVILITSISTNLRHILMIKAVISYIYLDLYICFILRINWKKSIYSVPYL